MTSHPSHDGPCQQACSHKDYHGIAYLELVTRRLRSGIMRPFLPCLGRTDLSGHKRFEETRPSSPHILRVTNIGTCSSNAFQVTTPRVYRIISPSPGEALSVSRHRLPPSRYPSLAEHGLYGSYKLCRNRDARISVRPYLYIIFILIYTISAHMRCSHASGNDRQCLGTNTKRSCLK